MVVNASNAEKITQWLVAVNERQVVIDNDNPGMTMEGKVSIRDIREEKDLSNVALQGPKSVQVLEKLINNPAEKERLMQLKKSFFAEYTIGGIKSIVARTGYTGEDIGFEILVPYKEAPKFWNLILEAGAPLGVKACGLAARDSLRTEAGLPLYGHELSGANNIIPMEAGYGAFVKRHKPFFIGRKAHLEKEAKSARQVVRFQITTQGSRAIKPGDPVVNKRGEYIGLTTSATLVGPNQIGLVLINKSEAKEGAGLRIYPLPSAEKEKPEIQKRSLKAGDQVLVPEEAVIVSRFPLRK